MVVINGDSIDLIKEIKSESIDLILTDPPYNISRKSGFSSFSTNSKEDMKKKYGCISIDFGYWDTELDLDSLFKEYWRVLKKGGTLIIFYDIWKSDMIKKAASNAKFKQPRICQWVKTNPTPINSKINYLTNSIEFFFTFVKGKCPKFNSKYDNGIYSYPICHGKERTEHPTQKPLELIKSIILKHSDPGDTILDTFGGSGTTACAALETNRDYIIMERDISYYNIMIDRIEKSKKKIK